MNPVRLHAVTAFLLLFISAATVAAWARQSSGNSAAADVPAAPEAGGPRNWQVTDALNLREQPTIASNIITTYPPGAIFDNLGCLRADDRIWCDVQQLGGGLRGYVAAEFLRPAVSHDGSVAMGPDTSAFHFDLVCDQGPPACRDLTSLVAMIRKNDP